MEECKIVWQHFLLQNFNVFSFLHYPIHTALLLWKALPHNFTLLRGVNFDSYTQRTLHACCSQSELTTLKIRESSTHALFLYSCTLRNLEHLAQCLHARKHCAGLICYTGIYILLAISIDIFNCKMSDLSHLKKTKSLFDMLCMT